MDKRTHAAYKKKINHHQGKPAEIIRHIFECYQLQELKDELWEWFSNAISKENSIYDEGIERNNLITLYENIELLVEAAWLMHNQKPKSRL